MLYNWKRLKSLDIFSVPIVHNNLIVCRILIPCASCQFKYEKVNENFLFLTKISTQETKKNLRFVYFYKGKISFARLYLLLAI